MAAKTFYATNTLLGSTPKWGEFSESSPGATATSSPNTGWTVGTATPTKYKEADMAEERSAPTGAGELPNGTINDGGGTNRAGWRSPKLTAKFEAGKWVFHGVMRAVTAGGAFDGAVTLRLWRGSNETGEGATLLTAALVTGSTMTNLATSADQDSLSEFELGEVSLTNEYLFLEVAIKVTGAGGGSTHDAIFRYGDEGVRLVTTNEAGGATPVEVPLGSAAGTSSTSLALKAPTSIPLGSAAGAAATSLALKVPTTIPLGSAAGAASTSLSVSAEFRVPLGPASGVATTSLALRAPTRIVLGAAAGSAITSLSLTVRVPPTRAAVSREYPPDQLAWRIDPPNGAPSRWAADESLVENVATGIQLTDEMPGGDKEGTCVLARNPRTPWPDLAAYSEISVYGPGVEEVGSYRLDKAPESDGERMSITPAAVGHVALLDDDQAIIGPGFVDRDLSRWGEPSLSRRKALLEGTFSAAGINLLCVESTVGAGDDGVPGLIFRLGQVVPSRTPIGELWYRSGGPPIGSISFDGVRTPTGLAEDAHMDNKISAASDDDATGQETIFAVHQTNAPAWGAAPATAGMTRLIAMMAYTESLPANEYRNSYSFEHPTIFGNQGLSAYGTWPNQGYTASQMLGYAIPLYTDLKAEPEDLEDAGYVIQQAWYADPGPMSAVVQDIVKYELLDWFVFSGKRFQLRFPGTYGRKWQAYAGPSGLSEAGLDSSRLWRSIVVSYQDVDGSTKTVGPPGSGAVVEDAGLEIMDPDHPAVRADITRQDLLSLGTIATPTRAIEAGERFLQEANLLSRSGSATLSGYIQDDRGIYRPVSQLRAGDQVRFPDAADTSYRKVVRRSYDHDSRTVSVDLDAPAEGLQALLERMQADIQSLQLS